MVIGVFDQGVLVVEWLFFYFLIVGDIWKGKEVGFVIYGVFKSMLEIWVIIFLGLVFQFIVSMVVEGEVDVFYFVGELSIVIVGCGVGFGDDGDVIGQRLRVLNQIGFFGSCLEFLDDDC